MRVVQRLLPAGERPGAFTVLRAREYLRRRWEKVAARTSSLILGIGNFYDNIRPEAPGCKTAPEPPRQMLFPIRGRCCFFGKAAEPPRQMHSQMLAIRNACGIAPEPSRQMHFQVLAICRACGTAPEPTRQMHFQALAIGRACGIAPEQPRQMHFQLARHVVVLGICGNAPKLSRQIRFHHVRPGCHVLCFALTTRSCTTDQFPI